MTLMIRPGTMQSSMTTLVRGTTRSAVVMNGRNRRRTKAKAARLWIGRRGVTINWMMMGTTTPEIVALHRTLTMKESRLSSFRLNLRGGHQFGQPEVEHFDGITAATVRLKPDVLRLQVSVDGPLLVRLVDR